MKAGETVRFDCHDCNREFEVTLEPKASGNPKAARNIPPGTATHCPFCGSTNIEGDE